MAKLATFALFALFEVLLKMVLLVNLLKTYVVAADKTRIKANCQIWAKHIYSLEFCRGVWRLRNRGLCLPRWGKALQYQSLQYLLFAIFF